MTETQEVDSKQRWLEDLFASRRTVHEYSTKAVPDEIVDGALRAALTAPNHRMTEPWRFISVGEAARARLAEISVELKRKKGALTPRGEESIRVKMLNPPRLIVVCRVRDERPDVAREDYAAVACALQNAMLYLWAHGVGSKWSTGAVTSDEVTRVLLAVPEKEEIVGFFWIGYPSQEGDKPKRKLALPDVLRRVP